jgi:hypothetical protein
MNAFLTDFWRDAIAVAGLLLSLVPAIVAAVAKLASTNTLLLRPRDAELLGDSSRGKMRAEGYKKFRHLGAGAIPAKIALFEEYPFQHHTKNWITRKQVLSIIILTGSVAVTFLGSYFLPMLDASSSAGYILKALLLILSVGSALIQVGMVLSLAMEALVRSYPKLELWFFETSTGNGLASLLCLLLLVLSYKIFDTAIGDHRSWNSYLLLAYSFAGSLFAFSRLLLGAGLAVEHAAAIIKNSRAR